MERDENWGSIKEVAELLNISDKTIRRRIADGTIRAERFGPRLIRIDMSSLSGSPIGQARSDEPVDLTKSGQFSGSGWTALKHSGEVTGQQFCS